MSIIRKIIFCYYKQYYTYQGFIENSDSTKEFLHQSGSIFCSIRVSYSIWYRTLVHYIYIFHSWPYSFIGFYSNSLFEGSCSYDGYDIDLQDLCKDWIPEFFSLVETIIKSTIQFHWWRFSLLQRLWEIVWIWCSPINWEKW